MEYPERGPSVIILSRIHRIEERIQYWTIRILVLATPIPLGPSTNGHAKGIRPQYR